MSLVAGHVYIYRCAWIEPPHDKIALCICGDRNWVFWFNSKPCFHGQGQLAVGPADCPAALTRNGYLDLSGVKAVSPSEVGAAADRGPISPAFRAKICAALAQPIAPLPPTHKALAIENLK
jgi:hypothetical protein